MTDPQTQSTRVGVVAESGPDERRVALVPKAVASLVNRGVAVVVEAGAGVAKLVAAGSALTALDVDEGSFVLLDRPGAFM